jgi:copper homeostasis protein
MIREACVETLAEALKAQELGADRLELCTDLAMGGTTPSTEIITGCKKSLKIPVVVMIRPRNGNFIYSPAEVKLMLQGIAAAKDAGADGIVTGVLTPDREVDLEILRLLVEQADPLWVTFHKAIDETRDIQREIVRLCDSGIRRVLSSGGAATAREGTEMLNSMIRISAGKLAIIAAGKITASNLPELRNLIDANEFHGRKIVGELTGLF